MKKSFFWLIICCSFCLFLCSCSKQRVLYVLENVIIYETKIDSEDNVDFFDWIYIEDYYQLKFSDHHFYQYDTVNCASLVKVKWTKTDSGNTLNMTGEVLSVLRANTFDCYNYNSNDDSLLISGILYSKEQTLTYPTTAYSFDNNTIKKINKFSFVDFEKLEFKNTPGIIGTSPDIEKVRDANQFYYLNNKISRVVIPEQYTIDKPLTNYIFSDSDLVDEIIFEGYVNKINPLAFSNLNLNRIVFNNDINEVDYLGFNKIKGDIILTGNVTNYNDYSFNVSGKILSNEDNITQINYNIFKYNDEECLCTTLIDFIVITNQYNDINQGINIKFKSMYRFDSYDYNLSVKCSIDEGELITIFENERFTKDPENYNYSKESFESKHFNSIHTIKLYELDELEEYIIPLESLSNNIGTIKIYYDLKDEFFPHDEKELNQYCRYEMIYNYEIIDDNIILYFVKSSFKEHILID
ncbi:MAG: leucine-rich repeat protein [Bacilli bacterium]|nr:leucine-rich repeat protein [Bacilli bacterium]